MASKSIPVIGLTGGIGAGKSRVAAIFRECGCVVSDADALAKGAIESPGVREAIRSRWGDEVFLPGGPVDRQAIASIIFQDATQRAWLESIIHPLVLKAREDAFATVSPGTPALVIDAPLLLEAGLTGECDAVVFVDTPEELRLKRLQEDRGWDAEELARREATQIPLDEKRSMAHHVLRNDGEVEDLARSVEDYLDSLIKDHSSQPGD